MALEVFNRHESKYLLSEPQFKALFQDLLLYMTQDEHHKNEARYIITNVYFDTEHHTLIRQSLTKPKYKEKLRVRAYGVPQPKDIVFLELKKKVNGLVNKRRTKISLEAAMRWVCEGVEPKVEPYMNQQVMEEIRYFLSRYHLQPTVYLAYERIALFGKDQRDIRVTFDTNILTRRTDVALEEGYYGEPLLEKEQWLMEVKAEKNIPLWLAQLLSKHQLYRTSFSKYGNEYKKNVRGNFDNKEEKS